MRQNAGVMMVREHGREWSIVDLSIIRQVQLAALHKAAVEMRSSSQWAEYGPLALWVLDNTSSAIFSSRPLSGSNCGEIEAGVSIYIMQQVHAGYLRRQHANLVTVCEDALPICHDGQNN
jgi:hypothetical protein